MNAAAPAAPLGRRQGRRLLVLLVTLAALPFVASWLFFFNPQWLPEPSAQHGTLLEPPLALADLELRTLDGGPLELPRGANAWLLLAVESGTCATACRERQIALRQARRATGVEQDRVVRVLALTAPPDAATRERLQSASPDLILALAGPALRDQAGSGPILLLGDPHGLLILRYAAASTPVADLLKDLKRLLRVSRSWPGDPTSRPTTDRSAE